MQSDLSKKIDDLNVWITQVFEDSIGADILNNARKAAEALCKAMILKRFPKNNHGSDIIGNIRRRDGTRTNKSNPRKLPLEQLIINVTDGSSDVVIPNKQQRSQVLTDLRLIQARGNIGSHDFNISGQPIKDSTIKLVRYTLIELVQWFYEEYLQQQVPEDIEPYIINSQKEYLEGECNSESQDLRGLDIVRLAHPRKRVKLALDCNEKSIGYEFVAVEVATNNIVGHIFIKSDISPDKTIKHFIDEVLTKLDFTLSTLQVCMPKKTSQETGSQNTRKEYINKIFNKNISQYKTVEKNLSERISFDYIDEFVWDFCLENEYLKNSQFHDSYGYSDEEYFVDQELFVIEDSTDTQKCELSLEYIKCMLQSAEKVHPVTAIVGPAGVGKTTFCDQAAKLINSYYKKKAVLISSEDFQKVSPKTEVNSISDLYQLVSPAIYCEHQNEILEPDNLEINISCGNIILIIDGIEEIESLLGFNFDINKFLKSVVELNKTYKRCSIIITSRDTHIEKYTKNPAIQTFKLLGFSEDAVKDYLLNKRQLKENLFRKAKKLLRDFKKDGDGQIPLYLSLVCDLLEDEEEFLEITNYEIEESKYFYSQIPFDDLIYKIVRRELVRQKIDWRLDCDRYIDVFIEINKQKKGEFGKDEFNNFINSIFPDNLHGQETSAIRNPFYVSPFLSTESNGDRFKFKYDFFSPWLICRYFLCQYERRELDTYLTNILSDLYDGTSFLYDELSDFQNAIRFCDIESGKYLLSELLVEYICANEENHKKILLRKAISGLLYFCMNQINDRSSVGYTKALIELFGKNKLEYICIFGEFVPLDFKSLEIHDGWLERYSNFRKSKFPDKTIFFNTTFRDTDPPKKLKYADRLFHNCVLNKAMEMAIDVSKLSAGQVQKRVREELTQIFKVAYKRKSFRWKSEYVYKEETSLPYAQMRAYLKFLVINKVFTKVPNRYKGPNGYLVADNYRESIKSLVLSGNIKPEMAKIIQAALYELYGYSS